MQSLKDEALEKEKRTFALERDVLILNRQTQSLQATISEMHILLKDVSEQQSDTIRRVTHFNPSSEHVKQSRGSRLDRFNS